MIHGKITAIGEMNVDGDRVIGAFVSCSVDELKENREMFFEKVCIVEDGRISSGGGAKDLCKLVSDKEIDKVWGNANFGSQGRRETVNLGVLKCASGYYQGHTSRCIITELGLIDKEYKITKRGREYLWAAFNDPNCNV